jgi:hypothetical protein
VYEFLKNDTVSSDDQECVNEWVRNQFRNNEPKEETEYDLPQRMFRFMDNNSHYGGEYHTGRRIANFLCSNNGLIGNIAQNKLEKIMVEFFPKQWYKMTVRENRTCKSFWICCEVWRGNITVKHEHVLSWKPSTIAQYIWRKIFQAVQQHKVPVTVLNMIDEIAVESDYDNIYLTNALFILNSKCGLLWGGYTHTDDAEFEYCYQERVVATRHGTLVEIKDMISQRYQYLPYDFLRKPAFNLVNWWRSDLRLPCSRHHLSEHWPNLSKSWAILEEDHSLNREDDLTEDNDYGFEYSDTESIDVEVYGIQAKAGMYSALQRNSSNV